MAVKVTLCRGCEGFNEDVRVTTGTAWAMLTEIVVDVLAPLVLSPA